jgi:hypothetical protein
MILLLTAGGPGDATRLVVQNMYQSAFGRLQPGYGVAQAIVLLPVLWAIFSAFQPPSRLFTFPPNFGLRTLSPCFQRYFVQGSLSGGVKG